MSIGPAHPLSVAYLDARAINDYMHARLKREHSDEEAYAFEKLLDYFVL